METEVHYRIHKSPQLLLVPDKINPVHTFTTCLFKINLPVILFFEASSPK